MAGNEFEEAWEVLYPSLKGRGNFKDLAGFRFGRLQAQEKIGADKHGSALWRCLCDCGNEKVVARRELRNKTVRSCGCLQDENRRRRRD